MNSHLAETYSLRKLIPSDWPLLKAIRLEALATNPSVYGSTLSLEESFPDKHWEDRIAAPYNAMWGLYYGEELIGLTSVYGSTENACEARLTTSFIRPEHRGEGLAAMFYTTRIEWARKQGLKRLEVTHRAGNEASRKANQRAGFRYTHSERRVWPDGLEADNMFYELILKP